MSRSKVGWIRSIGMLTAFMLGVIALAAACGPVGSTVQTVPSATATVQGTTAQATAAATTTPVVMAPPAPTDTPAPTATLEGTRRLLILHTNDVLGYTDPCG